MIIRRTTWEMNDLSVRYQFGRGFRNARPKFLGFELLPRGRRRVGSAVPFHHGLVRVHVVLVHLSRPFSRPGRFHDSASPGVHLGLVLVLVIRSRSRPGRSSVRSPVVHIKKITKTQLFLGLLSRCEMIIRAEIRNGSQVICNFLKIDAISFVHL